MEPYLLLFKWNSCSKDSESDFDYQNWTLAVGIMCDSDHQRKYCHTELKNFHVKISTTFPTLMVKCDCHTWRHHGTIGPRSCRQTSWRSEERSNCWQIPVSVKSICGPVAHLMLSGSEHVLARGLCHFDGWLHLASFIENVAIFKRVRG